MKTIFESPALLGTKKTSAVKYRNLHNLPHWHTEYELIFVLEGNAELMINNSTFEISKGICAFIDRKDIHYIKSTEETVIGVIKAKSDYITKIVAGKQLVSPLINRLPDVLQVFESTYDELTNENDFFEISAELTVTKFIIDIFRKEPLISKNEPDETFKILLEMLSANYAHVTFEDAAEYLHFNKSYFSSYFHHYSGMTFTQYLNILKVDAAIEKIHEKKMSMTEISVSCGFGTIRTFNRVFKSLTGYTPKNIPDDFAYIRNSSNSNSTNMNNSDPTLDCTKIIM